MPNHKVTFGPCRNTPTMVLVLDNQELEDARGYAQRIADANERLREEKRVLGPLLSVEPTEDDASGDTTLCMLGALISRAELGQW